MNHKHRKVLHALFAHPVSGNINFREVVHVLEDLGAEIEHKAGNRIGVTLAGHTVAFVHSHHDLSKDEVANVRRFLVSCGVDPASYPA